VLRVLEREAIRPDVICGTSSGAIIGLAYASGMTVDEMANVMLTLRWRQLVRPSVRRGGLLDTRRLDAFLESIIEARDFDDLDYVCATVACDAVTRERVVLFRGDPVRAARASAAIPGLFPPVAVDGRLLIDGAVVEPTPVSAARQLGADYVIGVDAVDRAELRARPRAARRTTPFAGTEAPSDRLVRPALGGFSAWDFSRCVDLVRAGEAAAERALPTIRTDLEQRAEVACAEQGS
jgi:NTE family protein